MEKYIPKREDLSHLQDLGESDKAEETLQRIPLPMTLNRSHEDIKKKNILDFGDEGYMLSNVLSQQECLHYITQGEQIGFGKIYGAKAEYRNSTRIMVQSEELANALWNRIKPFLNDIKIDGDPHKIHIHGVESLLKGKWRPLQLNSIFRLCKYEPGGHFAPHFDGHLVKSSSERSLKTLMLYLNADFDNGTTNFVDERQELYMDSQGKYCAEEKNVVYKMRPEPGLALVFNHHRLHEGEAVRNGVKYILRTDVMYERTEGESIDPKEEEALHLAQEAERLECSGDQLKAMELYRKAFKMSPSLAASYGN